MEDRPGRTLVAHSRERETPQIVDILTGLRKMMIWQRFRERGRVRGIPLKISSSVKRSAMVELPLMLGIEPVWE